MKSILGSWYYTVALDLNTPVEVRSIGSPGRSIEACQNRHGQIN
jgi:hypothetical protein